jgi:hypothetical protein
MIQPETILRDTALTLPFLVGVGAVLEGGWGALGVVVAGVLVLGNLWVLGRLVRRLTASMAGEDDGGGFAVYVLLLKLPLFLGLGALLVWVFGGVPVGIALSSLVFAVFLRGVVMLVQDTRDDLAQRSR